MKSRASPFRQIISVATLALVFFVAQPAHSVTLSGKPEGIALEEYYTFLEDTAGTLTYAEVTASAADEFQPRNSAIGPNFGYSRSAYWFRVTLISPPTAVGEWLLELPSPSLDYVSVYLRSTRSGDIVVQYHTGDRLPFSERPLPEAHFAFPLLLTPGEEYELHIRVQSAGKLTVRPVIWRGDIYQVKSREHHMLASIYLGVLLALLGYSLTLFLSLRDNVYLFYMFFILATLLHQGSSEGYAFEYLWPSFPLWGNLSALAGLNAIGLFGALFSRSFLNTRINAPLADGAILAFAFLFASLLIGLALMPYHVNAILTTLAVGNFSIVAMLVSAVCVQKGIRSARFFFLAWTLLVAGNILVVAKSFSIVPTNTFTTHGMKLGSLLALALLSYALSERILAMHREKETAEAAVRAKDEFLATVSHEIRTPLTVLLGSLGLLLDSGLQSHQSTLARSAKRSGEQLLTLLNDLIDLSRVASGRFQLQQRVFEAGTLLREVHELMEVPARDKGLSIDIHLSFDQIHLVSDPDRIRQVLVNLVFNAIKFTDRGKIYLESLLIERSQNESAVIRFSVVDTGKGIIPADQERMFHPFAQVETGSPGRGSGLGLAISRRLVEALGGRIHVFSRPDQGSRFWFDLELMTAPKPSSEGDKGPVRDVLPLRLLLVEDIYESRVVLAAQLRHAGYTVTAVDGGMAAIEAIKSDTFDAVLLDLQMPEMDGYSTLQYFRSKLKCEIPVFALTANVGAETQLACVAAGMQGVIAKPLQIPELNAKLLALFPDVPGHAMGTSLCARESIHLDEATLDERLALLGTEGMMKVICTFIEVADHRAAAVNLALQKGDIDGLARAAHLLRGSAGAVGMSGLLELAGGIEHAAQQSLQQAGALAEQLPATLQLSIVALGRWCSTRGIKSPWADESWNNQE